MKRENNSAIERRTNSKWNWKIYLKKEFSEHVPSVSTIYKWKARAKLSDDVEEKRMKYGRTPSDILHIFLSPEHGILMKPINSSPSYTHAFTVFISL